MTMKKTFLSALVVLLALGVGSVAFAGPSDTQTVTYQVQPINEISVSGDPAALVVNTATAGLQPNPVTDATTTYAITTNESNKKITGVLDSNMPTGLTLRVTLVAPTIGTTAGTVPLTAVAANLVTAISTVADNLGNTITYELDALVTAGVVPSAVKTVTFTITN